MSTRRLSPSLTGLVGAVMWVIAAAYTVGLVLQPPGFVVAVDVWLNIAAIAAPALVCWAAVLTAGGRRLELVFMAVGCTSYAIGNALLAMAAARHVTVVTPAWSDAGFLLFYPAVLAALVTVARRALSRRSGQVWWDAAVAALGGATGLAVLLAPVFSGISGSPLQMIVAAAYPAADMTLVAVLLGLMCLHGARFPRRWLPLIAGLALFAAADISYTLRVAAGGYTVGTPMDGLWALGLATLATWTVRCGRERSGAGIDSGEQPYSPSLLVPGLSSGVALAVLVAGSTASLSRVILLLATATVLTSAGRTHVAYRQLRRMAQLTREARSDDLTGLANRRAFYDHAGRRLAQGSPFTLLLIDLNRFKEVNDSLGHHVGDQLLQQVARRLAAQIRAGDLLARLGGDEFVVLADAGDADAALSIADRVHEALSAGFELDGITVHAHASIGLALAPHHGRDVAMLLRRADIAMYRAKSGRYGNQLWQPNNDEASADRLRLQQELREGLRTGQLVLHYQPKIDLHDGQVHSVEALVRWQHPHQGLLYPDAFLGLAEDAGLMHELTTTVLHLALRQAAHWHAAGHPLSVAVNLPPSALMDAQLAARMTDLLRQYDLAPAALQLEITEDAIMGDRERAAAVLTQLRAAGVRIAIDDFGTGFSSLAYLRDLPVDDLKLDRSFIMPATSDDRAAALVSSTVILAHSLGLRMVAEGVEDLAGAEQLQRFGCDQAQGYLYSRPVPADQLIAWITSRASAAAAAAGSEPIPAAVAVG
ncbi:MULTISPECIES: bifunctional diguanylate cyclase/phosphodiesterase [unclassified Actinoplanes]|uniref:putative bifunctional diguanylate cyclase/phosphodiesterase n=1 Tax=unclassified Actinoplanes TaxID=2626549 RepID=UPI0002F90319|nr:MULTISPECIES: EAL domain-containing protein [unclassified Actinoplanes]